MSTEMPLQSIFVQDQEPLHSVKSAAITTSVAGLNDIDDIRVQLQSAAIDIDDNTSNIHEHRIFKVHDRLRRYNPEAYEPECVSIGPYHRDKVNLQVMQKHKERFLEELLQDPKAESSSKERYTAALTEVEEQARRFYGDEISLSKDEFVDMMLLDGCFIIEFLRRNHNCKLRVQEDGDIFNSQWLYNAIAVDLILFENQVPFFILVRLFDMTKFRDNGQQNLIQTAMFVNGLVPEARRVAPNDAALDENQVIHLLDLLHKSCTSSFAVKFPSTTDDRDDDVNADDLIEYIKSTSELGESGVKFEKATRDAAWLDITWENGVIKIPQLTILDITECVLRNIIAHEQHFPDSQRTYISDYVTVMDLLINSSRDVEKLRRRQIIRNWLGDDEAVSTMFNKLTIAVLTISTPLFCYRDVLTKVNEFSSKRWNIWRANLTRNYFNSPWSIISFLAAVVLLILTLLQTIFTILSSNKN